MLTGPLPAFLAFGLCASALRVGLPARRAERRQADATLPCTCPLDKFNSTGTLIAWAPVCLTPIPFIGSVIDLGAQQYSCAYPFGVCTWLQTGAIESSTSSACPASAACVGSACVCPTDQTGASGTFLNQSTPYTVCILRLRSAFSCANYDERRTVCVLQRSMRLRRHGHAHERAAAELLRRAAV
jgi:hypothetical protein